MTRRCGAGARIEGSTFECGVCDHTQPVTVLWTSHVFVAPFVELTIDDADLIVLFAIKKRMEAVSGRSVSVEEVVHYALEALDALSDPEIIRPGRG